MNLRTVLLYVFPQQWMQIRGENYSKLMQK